jgi:hypothetical protein
MSVFIGSAFFRSVIGHDPAPGLHHRARGDRRGRTIARLTPRDPARGLTILNFILVEI